VEVGGLVFVPELGWSGQCSDLAWDNLITLQVRVDKKNSIEFPLDSVHYLYNYYMVCALLSYTYHVTPSYDVMS